MRLEEQAERVVMETAAMIEVRLLSSKNEVFNELGAAEGMETVSVSGLSVVVISPSVVVWITGLVLSTRMSRIVDPSVEEIIVDIDSELAVSTIVLVSLSVSDSVENVTSEEENVTSEEENVTSEGENVVTRFEFWSTRAAK